MLNGISRPIYIAVDPVDMRKSFDGLSAIVKNHFRHDPLTGHLFVFINRSADRIKILYWDNDGYAIWCKRLQAGRFRIPVAMIGEGKQVALASAAQLAMILEGIEPVAVKKQKRFTLQNTGSN
jgi:transposase